MGNSVARVCEITTPKRSIKSEPLPETLKQKIPKEIVPIPIQSQERISSSFNEVLKESQDLDSPLQPIEYDFKANNAFQGNFNMGPGFLCLYSS